MSEDIWLRKALESYEARARDHHPPRARDHHGSPGEIGLMVAVVEAALAGKFERDQSDPPDPNGGWFFEPDPETRVCVSIVYPQDSPPVLRAMVVSTGFEASVVERQAELVLS